MRSATTKLILQARIAIRRAGLFASGHLGVAVREVSAEEGADPTLLSAPGGLAQLAAASPSVASLYQLCLGARNTLTPR